MAAFVFPSAFYYCMKVFIIYLVNLVNLSSISCVHLSKMSIDKFSSMFTIENPQKLHKKMKNKL